jgi:hypothetical protein
MKGMHLENIPKLQCNIPLILTQLVLSQFHITIAGHRIDCHDMPHSKVEHVKCRVPSCCNIMGHHMFSKFEILKNGEPVW